MVARKVVDMESWIRDIDRRLILQERRKRGVAAGSSGGPIGTTVTTVFVNGVAEVSLPSSAASATVVTASFAQPVGTSVDVAIVDGKVRMFASVSNGSYAVNLTFAGGA